MLMMALPTNEDHKQSDSVVAATNVHAHLFACLSFGCCWSPDDLTTDIGSESVFDLSSGDAKLK